MSRPQMEAPGPGGAGQAQEQDAANTLIVDKAVTDRKRQTDLQACAALAGIALHRLADGSWLACRWSLSKPLADHEVEAWLAQVGAR